MLHRVNIKDQATEWLRLYLSSGPKTVREVITAGNEAHFSQTSLYQAARDIDIVSMSTPGDRRAKTWSLS